jgi:hypothetical protein
MSVLGPFCIFNTSAIYYSIYNLWIFIIAFFIIFVYYMIISEGTSSSVIRKYIPNISKIDTRLSGLVVSLKVLNIICRAIFLLIPGNSIIMIW